MNLFQETLVVLFRTLYLLLEALVLFFVPLSYRKKDINGETVLVTGAGSGIGRLMAVKFAKLGAKVILWDINKEGNEETETLIREVGGSVESYVCDLSSRQDIYDTANRVKADIGQVTILVNNAGIVTGKKLLECDDKLIEKTMEVNTMAHFWTCKAFLPDMLKKDHGHIVNVASSAGLFGVNGLSDYCASKFAAVGFDESLRYELQATGKDGVKTTVVCPYYINTGMFKGVKTRFPWILPIVEPHTAVDNIMSAVLTNQKMVCIPRVLYLFYASKGLLPCSVQFELAQFFGINSCMDDFVGRSKTD